jgi:hypothetical protein
MEPLGAHDLRRRIRHDRDWVAGRERLTDELIGNFKNGGTDYRPKGNPRRVHGHDFEDKKLGKAGPYGTYDVTANAGFVSVGITLLIPINPDFKCS